MSFYGNDILLEYKGSEAKNKEFSDNLNNIKNFYDKYYNYLKDQIDILDKSLKYLESIKTIDQVKLGMPQDIIDKYNNIIKGFNPSAELSALYKDFIKLNKKFNNIYAGTSLNERKKLQDEIDNYIEKINKLVFVWKDGSQFNKFTKLKNNYYNLLNQLNNEELEKDNIDVAFIIEMIMLETLLNNSSYIINNMNNMLKMLNIDKIENSVGYKILNK